MKHKFSLWIYEFMNLWIFMKDIYEESYLLWKIYFQSQSQVERAPKKMLNQPWTCFFFFFFWPLKNLDLIKNQTFKIIKLFWSIPSSKKSQKKFKKISKKISKKNPKKRPGAKNFSSKETQIWNSNLKLSITNWIGITNWMETKLDGNWIGNLSFLKTWIWRLEFKIFRTNHRNLAQKVKMKI